VERYEEVLKAIFFVKLLHMTDLLGLADNVRRYVQLALLRGGARFCTRGAMQGYDVVLFIVALAKTVTPGGVPRGSGACRLVFALRLQPQSRADKAPTGFGVPVWRTGAQIPVEANCIYRPVMVSCFSETSSLGQ